MLVSSADPVLKLNTLSACAMSLAAVAVGFVMRRLLDPWLGQGYPFITLCVAIGFAAVFAGCGPTLMGVAASVALTALLEEPGGTLTIAAREIRSGLIRNTRLDSGVKP